MCVIYPKNTIDFTGPFIRLVVKTHKEKTFVSVKIMTLFDDYSLENGSAATAIEMNWMVTSSESTTITAATLDTVAVNVISTTISTTLSTSLASWLTTGRIQIILYITILLLAIIGNALVILTLIQNRRMRTITNVFLLNLAVSDILLGVLCMPFTLIGTLLRDFVFGELMCKLLPYLQGNNIFPSYYYILYMFNYKPNQREQ